MRRLGVLILAGALAGCATIEPASRTCTFEFPFIHDYSVVNRVAFEWSDDYLTNSACAYSQRLAGPLSALAAGVYGYRLGMDVRNLSEFDFTANRLCRRYGRELDYRDPKYGKNQVGFTFATRKTVLAGEVVDVLLVVARGTFGRQEWVSNMNICNEWGLAGALRAPEPPAFHEGFRKAADCLMEELGRYIAARGVNLANAKVLVTGHSRGAAVANLVGALLDDAAETGEPAAFAAIRRENLFVYTFATPNTVIRPGVDCTAPRYDNIFNVLNPEDTVTLVPIARWSARRFGRDLRLKSYDELPFTGSWTDGAYCRMKDEFRAMTGYEYWHTTFGTNSTVIIPKLLGALAPTIPELYSVPPDQRADGNLTSIHSVLETIVWRSMDDPIADETKISLGGDVANLSQAYTKVSEAGSVTEEPPAEARPDWRFMPDGRDFSRQPGMFNVGWRFACMHAPATYIGWMKAGDEFGPEGIYTNWKELKK